MKLILVALLSHCLSTTNGFILILKGEEKLIDDRKPDTSKVFVQIQKLGPKETFVSTNSLQRHSF